VESDTQYFLVGLLKQVALKLVLRNGFFLSDFNIVFAEQVTAVRNIFGRVAGCQDQYWYQDQYCMFLCSEKYTIQIGMHLKLSCSQR
jgi:hypothetical protein